MTGLIRLSCAGLLTVLIAAAPAKDRFRLMDQPMEICIVGGKKDGDCYRRVTELKNGVDVLEGFRKFRELDDKDKRAKMSLEDVMSLAPAVGVTRGRQTQVLEQYERLSVDHVSIDPEQGFDPNALAFDVAARIHFKRRGLKTTPVESVDIRGTVVTRNTLVEDLARLSASTLDENNAYAAGSFVLTEMSNDGFPREDVSNVVAPAVMGQLWFEAQRPK